MISYFFDVLNFFLSNEKELFKPAELYEYFDDMLQRTKNVEHAARHIVWDALIDLSAWGLTISPEQLEHMDYRHIIEALNAIQNISTLEDDADIENSKKKIKAKFSHWREKSNERFSHNSTILSYR